MTDAPTQGPRGDGAILAADGSSPPGSPGSLYAAAGDGGARGSAAATNPAGATPPAAAPVGIDQVAAISIWLGVIIVVLFAGSYALKRFAGFRDQAGSAIRVVASRSVGQRERIAVVDVNGRRLTLGVTAHSITRLDAQPASALAPTDVNDRSTNEPPTFKQALATNLRRAAGRGRRP